MIDQVLHGDALAMLKTLETNSVDSICCDPPAGINFMNKAFDSDRGGRDAWIAWLTSIMREAIRVLKNGGHAFVWALPRTSHWTAMALEDVGFEIRDSIAHMFGCLSEDTEILTANGWEQYHECVVGSLALCYNVNNKTLGYEPIQEVLIYDYDDTAYRIHSDSTDQLVSRNHRCIVERDGREVFHQAESLERYESVPVLEDLPCLLKALSLHGQSGDREKGDLFPTLQGPIRQDATGAIYSTQAAWKSEVCLSAQEDLRDMQERVLVPEPLSGKEEDMFSRLQEQDRRSEEFRSTQASKNGNMPGMRSSIPDEEWSENSHLLQSFMSRGKLRKGSRYEDDSSQRTQGMDTRRASISQTTDDRHEQSSLEGRSNHLQDSRQLYGSALREVSTGIHSNGTQRWLCDGTSLDSSTKNRTCVIENRSSASYQSRPNRQPDRELTTIRKQSSPQTVRASRFTRSDLATVTPVHYQGVVWCVRVPSGAFIARRNGKVFITGNSGFPKSLDVSKAIDRMAGKERAITGYAPNPDGYTRNASISNGLYELGITGKRAATPITAPATSEAAQWAGWGSALKPSHENWLLVRKPLSESSIAAQVLATGTGAINVDASRISTQEYTGRPCGQAVNAYEWSNRPNPMKGEITGGNSQGRFPSNTLFSHTPACVPCGEKRVRGTAPPGRPSRGTAAPNTGNVYGKFEKINEYLSYNDDEGMEPVAAWMCSPDCPVRLLDEQSGDRGNSFRANRDGHKTVTSGMFHGSNGQTPYNDQGGASRYFQCFPPSDVEDLIPYIYLPKASRRERNSGCEALPEQDGGNVDFGTMKAGGSGKPVNGTGQPLPRTNGHPTVKSLALMSYLIRMITPPNGIVLDMFAGSGSTGVACVQNGFHYILIEQELEYVDIIHARLAHAHAGSPSRTHEKGVSRVYGGGKGVGTIVTRCPLHNTPHGDGNYYVCGCKFARNKAGSTPQPITPPPHKKSEQPTLWDTPVKEMSEHDLGAIVKLDGEVSA